MRKNTFPSLLLFICLAAALSWNFCTISTSKINEGIIKFDCTPVDSSVKYSPITFPDNVVMKFKNNYSMTSQERGLGFAKMKFITDPVKKEFRTQVLFFEKKQSLLDSAAIRTNNYYLPDYDVEYGTKTKAIAGYNCRNAILKFKNGAPSYEVWFTRDIAIENPNWANPYYKIDGVLLDYRLKTLGLNLHYTATTISSATISDDEFVIPAEYEKVAHAELEKMFESF